ncbi:MAG: M1 family metallopeptidase [Bacteroidota bacterium]
MRSIVRLICLAFFFWSGALWAQDLPLFPEYAKALQNNSRNADGTPGKNYFQNRSDYNIKARLDPQSRKVTATETISYRNTSPDTLRQIVIRLYQDLYKPGFERDYSLNKDELTDGVILEKIWVDGMDHLKENQQPGYTRTPTNLIIDLAEPLLPNRSMSLDIDWHFTITAGNTVRMGTYGEYSFFVAYWFPQIAVYDDVYGWDKIEYKGLREFYNDFGDFRVALTVPDSFLVWATGDLQNPEKVLSEPYLKRYNEAWVSDEVVNIVQKGDYEKGPVALPDESGINTWIFEASGVPDFAFATSDYYLWDAASVVVDSAKNRRVLAGACYKQASRDFYQVAKYSRQILHDLSFELPGVPYPYTNMTVFNGDESGGGMEFPMMVNDASVPNAAFAFNLTAHEIAHTYFPFYMGINERRFAWMDEGWASFLPYDMMKRQNFPSFMRQMDFMGYTGMSGSGNQKSLMTYSHELSGTAYGINSYNHPSVAYYHLREFLGNDMFEKCLKAYMERWNGKHPMPYDFFNTFNDVSGQNLNWFWNPWFFKTGTADLGIQKAKFKGKKAILDIECASVPLPVSMKFTLKDGSTEVIEKPASVWKDGKLWHFEHSFSQKVVGVKLGKAWTPDKIGKNNRAGKK